MRVIAIVEARMTSTRLPGKTLAQIAGKPLLYYVLQRCAYAEMLDGAVVATPESQVNAGIWDFCHEAQIPVVKGSESDVLGRVVKAAREARADVVVEITGDCPLIDPTVIDWAAGYYLCGTAAGQPPKWDLVGNVKPRTWPRGNEVRVLSRELLERIDREVRGDAREAYWREHVTPWVYERDGFSVLNLEAEPQVTYPELNLSVDDKDDLRRVTHVIEALWNGNPRFRTLDALQVLAPLPGYEMLHASNLYTEPTWLKQSA